MRLPKTTRARLRLYRERAADPKTISNDWRKHIYGGMRYTWEPAWHKWSEDRLKIYADARDTLGDYLGDWGEFSGGGRMLRDTTGFYADSWCSDTIQGGVERIRSARGTYYVPVTYCTGWDGVTYYMADAEIVPRNSTEADHDTAKHEAARSAYHYAEREAEQAREDDAKSRAEEQIADARAEIHDINKTARALLAEIRGREFTQNVCEALRHRLREYMADRRRCFAIIKEREEDYWSAVSY
jgi:hypothetical protein